MTALFYLHNKQSSPFYLNYLYRTSAIVNFSCPLGQVPPKKNIFNVNWLKLLMLFYSVRLVDDGLS